MKKLIFRVFIALLFTLALCLPALAEQETVVFSLPSGFYQDVQQLEMSTGLKGAQIYYTTDGSIPDETDLLYEGALTLEETTSKADPLSHITGITPGEAYIVQKDFPSAHIIRAVAIAPDSTRSAITSGTYFVGYDRQELYGNTPIMLLAIDPSHLFDYETGIYVNGKYHDEWLREWEGPFESWQGKGNYSQRGSEWERPVTVTYLPAEGEGFTQDMGVRIKGGVSRTNNQKSLRLIARADYGEKNVKYELFPDNLRESDGEVVKKYKSFTLRNGGNDIDHGKIRDPFINRLATGLRMDTAANMPAIAFINGEYWGLYTLNEEYSDNFFDYHYGINNDNIVSIKVGEVEEGEDSDITLFEEMFDYVAWEDMTDPDCYAAASEMLDMGSFADFCALQFYIRNEDGPFHNNNWQMWRVRVPGQDDSPMADGKWRMMLYDTDYSSGVYDNGSTYYDNNIAYVINNSDEYYSSDDRLPALLFLSLIENEEFRDEFIDAACDIRNLFYERSRMGALLDEMTDWYLPYQPDTLLRFGPQWVSWDPVRHFTGHLKNIRTFFTGRYDSFPDIIKQTFELENPVNITVEIKGEGSVVINGREAAPITHTTAVRYFADEEGITVTAVPAEGKQFAGWQVSTQYGSVEDPSAETTTFTFSRIVKLTAVFN